MQDFYKTTAVATQTTTLVVAASNVHIHTVVCPKATTGTVTFNDVAGSPNTYFVLPIGSIGTFILDSVFPNGLSVITSAADTVLIQTRS